MTKRLLPLMFLFVLAASETKDSNSAPRRRPLGISEIIVRYIDIDKQGAAFFPPFQEFAYTPKMPVTVYMLKGDIKPARNIQFSYAGFELGEQDSSGNLWGRVSDFLFVRGRFQAIPHKIAPGVTTRRTVLGMGADAYLGDNFVVSGEQSEENKTGKNTAGLRVGQQERATSGTVHGVFNRFGFTAGDSESRFRDTLESHNLKRSSANIMIPGRRLALNGDLSSFDVKPANSVTLLDSIRATSGGITGVFNLNTNTLLSARYSARKTDNHNDDTSSVDGRQFSTGVQYNEGPVDLNGSYSTENRDFTGTDTARQELETADASGRLHYKNWTLAAKISRQVRNVSGIGVTNLTDFEELSQKLQVASVNLSTTALNNTYIAYWANQSRTVFDPLTPFGAGRRRSLKQNAYISYYGIQRATVYYNFVDTEYLAEGNQRILNPDPTPVPYELLEDSRFHQIGVDIEANTRTTCGLSYSFSVSDSGDLFAVNKIKERTYSLSLSHRFRPDFRLFAEFSRGIYKDALGASVSGHANRAILQVEKKF